VCGASEGAVKHSPRDSVRLPRAMARKVAPAKPTPTLDLLGAVHRPGGLTEAEEIEMRGPSGEGATRHAGSVRRGLDAASDTKASTCAVRVRPEHRRAKRPRLCLTNLSDKATRRLQAAREALGVASGTRVTPEEWAEALTMWEARREKESEGEVEKEGTSSHKLA